MPASRGPTLSPTTLNTERGSVDSVLCFAAIRGLGTGHYARCVALKAAAVQGAAIRGRGTLLLLPQLMRPAAGSGQFTAGSSQQLTVSVSLARSRSSTAVLVVDTVSVSSQEPEACKQA